MSSIAAGTTTGSALVSTGDTTGELVLKTNGTTTAVTIDTNQNVTIEGDLTVNGTLTASLTGAATSAATWTTARTLSIGGTGKSVNGSADVTWTTAEIGINTTNVLDATAGASLGAVGTYAMLGRTATGTTTAGDTIAGSDLRFMGLRGNASWATSAPSLGGSGSTNTPSGTWMYVSQQTANTQQAAGVWLRIS